MSDPNLEQLRRHLVEAQDRQREGCADVEEIWSASRGEADPARARELLEHSLECGPCAEAWRLAADLGAQVPATASRRSGGDGRRSAGILVLIAALVVMVLALPRLVQGPDAPPSELRNDGASPVTTLIPEDQPLERASATLRWTAGPEGALYDVEVTDEQLNVLHVERSLDRPEAEIPPEALEALPAGATIYWRVEVVLPDGSRQASSTFIHRLR